MEFNYIKEIINPKFLSLYFLDKYKDVEPPFGSDFGYVVYLRTYSRYIPELNRRENWMETVARVVEYSMSLYQGSASIKELQDEAQQLYDHIFNMKIFPSGRTLWVGGVKGVDGLAQYNCAFRSIDNIEAFVDVFYALLLGTGIGFSVEKTYTSSLLSFNKELKIYHYPIISKPKELRQEYTTVLLNEGKIDILLDEDFLIKSQGKLLEDTLDIISPQPKLESRNNWYHKIEDFFKKKPEKIDVNIVVGDSKNGWVNALKAFLYLHQDKRINSISFNYNNIRPKGERIAKFGGRASGPESLRRMFKKIAAVIQSSDKGKLSSVNCMDICNSIAENVVSGGVRRSSLITLGDITDTDFIEAKLNLYTDKSLAHLRSSRSMSNNSVHFKERPRYEELEKIFENIKNNGEPGLINHEAASKRRPNYQGVNPCGEILLRSEQCCNLVTIVLPKFVSEYGTFRQREFDTACKLATRHCSRITNLDIYKTSWNKVQKEDRLLGVSLTGIIDATNKLYPMNTVRNALDIYSINLNIFTFNHILEEAKKLMRKEADSYHEEMGIPKSLLITTIKPEGTISNLPTVSSGIHAPHAPYYKRRIRVNREDPIAKSLFELDVPVVPENNQGDDLFADECDTWVFTFPIKTSANFNCNSESAISQLERYKIAMDKYVEHNCSITIYVGENEWEQVTNWVFNNWDTFVGISFLPKFDSSNTTYPNLPYEACSEEEYNKLLAVCSIDKDELMALVNKYETTYEEFTPQDSCSTGFCPIR